MFTHILNSDDDYWELIRAWLLTRLDPFVDTTGLVTDAQYVGYFDEDEDVIEDELVDLGARRNLFSYYKTHEDGRHSEGSWAILHGDAPALVEPGMQLHLTLFEREDGGRELYAHYEHDWRVSPIAHLAEQDLEMESGVYLATRLIDTDSFLTLHA